MDLRDAVEDRSYRAVTDGQFFDELGWRDLMRIRKIDVDGE